MNSASEQLHAHTATFDTFRVLTLIQQKAGRFVPKVVRTGGLFGGVLSVTAQVSIDSEMAALASKLHLEKRTKNQVGGLLEDCVFKVRRSIGL